MRQGNGNFLDTSKKDQIIVTEPYLQDMIQPTKGS